MTEPIARPIERHDAGPGRGAPKRIRVAELDLLRFLAALAVVLYHYTYRLRVSDALQDAFPSIGRLGMHGYLGVNLFFMISGFVVLWTARDRSPSEFVVSRVARLYPEFWIGVILSAVAFSVDPSAHARRITPAMVAANMTMVPDLLGYQYVDDVYWTLFVELKFYFILWSLSTLRQMRRIEWWIFAWLFLTVACFVFDVPHALRSATMYPYSPLFIAGCLFYLMRFEGPRPHRLAGVVVCAALAAMNVVTQMRSFVEVSDVSDATRFESRLVIVAFFVAFAVISLRSAVTVPFAGVMAFLGMLTYPLYLIHNIGKALILRPLAAHQRYGALLLAAGFSLALAASIVFVVDRYWRRPFTEWIRRIIVRTSRRAPS